MQTAALLHPYKDANLLGAECITPETFERIHHACGLPQHRRKADGEIFQDLHGLLEQKFTNKSLEGRFEEVTDLQLISAALEIIKGITRNELAFFQPDDAGMTRILFNSKIARKLEDRLKDPKMIQRISDTADKMEEAAEEAARKAKADITLVKIVRSGKKAFFKNEPSRKLFYYTAITTHGEIKVFPSDNKIWFCLRDLIQILYDDTVCPTKCTNTITNRCKRLQGYEHRNARFNNWRATPVFSSDPGCINTVAKAFIGDHLKANKRDKTDAYNEALLPDDEAQIVSLLSTIAADTGHVAIEYILNDIDCDEPSQDISETQPDPASAQAETNESQPKETPVNTEQNATLSPEKVTSDEFDNLPIEKQMLVVVGRMDARLKIQESQTAELKKEVENLGATLKERDKTITNLKETVKDEQVKGAQISTENARLVEENKRLLDAEEARQQEKKTFSQQLKGYARFEIPGLGKKAAH